jgi:hypothetical protein
MGKWIVGATLVVGLAAAGSASATPSKAPAPVVVKVGQTRAFAPSRLRPGQRVQCVDDGHMLSIEAPSSPAISTGTVWTQAGTPHFHLHVTPVKAGGYVVNCGPGAIHWTPIAAGNKQARPPADSFLIA